MIRSVMVAFILFFLYLTPPLHAGGQDQVVITLRPLGIGETIGREDVVVVHRERRSPREASNLGEVVGKRVRRPIGRGNTVKLDYLEDPPLVRRGEEVLLLLEKGKLRITAKGVAKDEGSKGDIVRVENISSGKVIRGRVVEQRIVRVDF